MKLEVTVKNTDDNEVKPAAAADDEVVYTEDEEDGSHISSSIHLRMKLNSLTAFSAPSSLFCSEIKCFHY